MLFDVTCNFEAVPRDYVPCYKCMSHAMSYQTRVFPFGRGRVYLVNKRSQRHNSYSAVLSLRNNMSSIFVVVPGLSIGGATIPEPL